MGKKGWWKREEGEMGKTEDRGKRRSILKLRGHGAIDFPTLVHGHVWG